MKIKIDKCAIPSKSSKDDLEVIKRGNTEEVIGYRCKVCNGWWKVYQNVFHNPGCKHKSKDGTL